MHLNLEPNMSDPDSFYQALMDAQRGMDEEQALHFQARLLLILANQVGEQAVLMEAIATARKAG
jgi:hypothetical protein